MSKRMVTYSVSDDDKIASIDGHELGSGGLGDKSISRRMITYKVDDTGKITSIDGHELAGGGGGDLQIKELVVTENGVYDVTGEAYKPVRVNVPQTAQSGTLKALLDATQSASHLFYNYHGENIDGLISSKDTSSVTNMSYMFAGCANLISIPALDTHSVVTMEQMFRNCRNLTAIPALDATKVTNMIAIFEYCNNLSSIGMYGFTRSVNISTTALGHDAIVAFLNQAGTAFNSSQKITMEIGRAHV